jgi:N-acetylmuramoyl-L-alanine amidase
MNAPATIERPSPNFDPRPDPPRIDILLLHYTGMKSADESLDRLRDPAAKVSAHYLIDEDGATYRLVAEARRAWHAGASFWAGETDINGRSIGIELQNPGHEWGYRAFPEAQMRALIALARDIVARHAIPPARVLAHSDVAPARKQDPGELFDWTRLAGEGIGRLPGRARPGAPDDDAARALLSAIGYDPAAPLADVVAAFQRHWRRTRVDGALDAGTMGLIRALAP